MQDRHRSSAWFSSGGASQPETTPPPLIISCSTRARPRVESFSSRVAWYEGHITDPDPRVSETHLPTPVQAWICHTSLSSVRRRGALRICGTRRFCTTGSGSTSTPRIQQIARIEDLLDLLHQGQRLGGEYMIGSSAERARPSPCSPLIDPPYPATSSAASVTKSR